MNVSLVIGLVAGTALGVYLGTHRKAVVSFLSAVGLFILVGAFYALAIVGIAWLGGFLYVRLGFAPWQFGVMLAIIIVVGVVGDRLLSYREKRPSK